MKRCSIRILLFAAIFTLMCSAASAQTITPVDIEPVAQKQASSYARILGYHEESNTLTVELILPEIFSCDDVEALRAGDIIYTNGREVLIETIESVEWGSYFINEVDEPDFVSLVMDADGNYMTKRYGDYVWSTLTEIECPVRESMLFLDYIDDQTGNPLELPVVHTARELTEEMLFTEAYEAFTAGFTCNNVYITFDEEGNLATIHRFYVPWQ